MTQSPHNRVAELHNLAAHAHKAASVSQGKGDPLSAHELSMQVQAQEHSAEAHRHSEKLLEDAKK